VSVDPAGWAHFEYVKLPISLGHLLADPVHDPPDWFWRLPREEVWQGVPGEFRNQLRRLVGRGETTSESVEQQRWLGQRCPAANCTACSR
jgi:benzoyl-CoA 2,3-dioxygenase component B